MPALVHIADLILAVIAVEALVLWRRGAIPVARFLPNLLSGAFLVAALRIALLPDGPWPLLLACLGGSFAAHLYDLYRMHR